MVNTQDTISWNTEVEAFEQFDFCPFQKLDGAIFAQELLDLTSLEFNNN